MPPAPLGKLPSSFSFGNDPFDDDAQHDQEQPKMEMEESSSKTEFLIDEAGRSDLRKISSSFSFEHGRDNATTGIPPRGRDKDKDKELLQRRLELAKTESLSDSDSVAEHGAGAGRKGDSRSGNSGVVKGAKTRENAPADDGAPATVGGLIDHAVVDFLNVFSCGGAAGCAPGGVGTNDGGAQEATEGEDLTMLAGAVIDAEGLLSVGSIGEEMLLEEHGGDDEKGTGKGSSRRRLHLKDIKRRLSSVLRGKTPNICQARQDFELTH